MSRRLWNALVLRGQQAVSSALFHLFGSAALLVVVFLHPPMLFSGDTDTARNYLNTIVSSLSTILALCISIILVAIQLAASNYTHRVLDFYVRLPYNVSLFLFYLVTMMHSFFLMAKIRDPLRDPLPSSLSREMSADLVLVIICFLSLLVYMYAVIQLLKPERIINLVLRDYNQAFLRKRYPAALDNVEQLCDIAKRAASFSDSVTGMRCTQAMLDIVRGLPMPNDDKALLKIHQNLIDQWVEILGVAVKEKETGLLYAVLDGLQAQGELYVESQSWLAAERVIRAYRHLAFTHLLAEGQVFYADKVATHLYQLAACAAKQQGRGEVFAVRTWNIVRMIGESTLVTDPASSTTLMSGLLLAEPWRVPLQHMKSPVNQMHGLALYFQMWRTFVTVAARKDIARWARWWASQVQPAHLQMRGQALALLLAHHERNQDAMETMFRCWCRQANSVTSEDVQDVDVEDWTTLFDGWSVSDIMMQWNRMGKN